MRVRPVQNLSQEKGQTKCLSLKDHAALLSFKKGVRQESPPSHYLRSRTAITVTSASAAVVKIVEIQITASPPDRIWTMDNTEARIDTMPKMVMILMTVSLRARSISC